MTHALILVDAREALINDSRASFFRELDPNCDRRPHGCLKNALIPASLNMAITSSQIATLPIFRVIKMVKLSKRLQKGDRSRFFQKLIFHSKNLLKQAW